MSSPHKLVPAKAGSGDPEIALSLRAQRSNRIVLHNTGKIASALRASQGQIRQLLLLFERELCAGVVEEENIAELSRQCRSGIETCAMGDPQPL